VTGRTVIDVEIEDEAWATVADAEAVVRAAAEAVFSSSPLRDGAQLSVPTRGDVTILLADDETVRDLNARFRSKDAATNVLSFPAPQTARPHLGDIVLAFGVCAGEAKAQGKTLAQHLSHLTAHGVLHLLGYDHQTEADAEVMEGLERAILKTLGVPDPYAFDGPDARP
jgi:probable rRNA maturation factor